ncbi:hypothetical protein YTXLTZUM_CDS0199 [Enterococcus phage VRE9_3]
MGVFRNGIEIGIGFTIVISAHGGWVHAGLTGCYFF